MTVMKDKGTPSYVVGHDDVDELVEFGESCGEFVELALEKLRRN